MLIPTPDGPNPVFALPNAPVEGVVTSGELPIGVVVDGVLGVVVDGGVMTGVELQAIATMLCSTSHNCSEIKCNKNASRLFYLLTTSSTIYLSFYHISTHFCSTFGTLV